MKQNYSRQNSFPAKLIVLLIIILRFNLILSLMQPFKIDSFKYCNAVKLAYDPLSLMTKLSMSYLNEFLIFSSMLYNILQQVYRFLRSSDHCIFSWYSRPTI